MTLGQIPYHSVGTMTLIGKPAPDFKAKAVINGKIVEGFSLSQFLDKRYIVLFFYPKDFSPVCPRELHAFQKRLKDFEDRHVQVIACSTDSDYCHKAFVQTPKEQGGAQGVSYPIVSDASKAIAHSYGVLSGDCWLNEAGELETEGERVAYRGLFLIDKHGIVQHSVVNNMTLGRSVNEALRIVDALIAFEHHGEICSME